MQSIRLGAIVGLCAVAGAALAAGLPTFKQGPSGILDDPTIPKVFNPATGMSLALTAKLVVVDLLGSGRNDVVVLQGVGVKGLPQSAWAPAPIHILRPTGTGTLADVTRQVFGPGPLPTLAAPTLAVVGDFNNDGMPDLYVGELGMDEFPWPGSTNLLLESTPGGTWANRSASLPAIANFTHSGAGADVDGDGLIDIYVGNTSNHWEHPEQGPYLLKGKSDGSFDRVTSTLPEWLTSDGMAWWPASQLVDVDGDGYPDLVLGGGQASQKPTDSMVLLNDGKGDFTRRTPIKLPEGAAWNLKMAAIDANGDGFQDLVILGTTFQYSARSVRLLINRGDGSFVDETATRLGPRASVASGFQWEDVRIADINGDGRPDILLGSIYSPDPYYPPEYAWINNGDGTFSPLSVAALSPPPLGMFALTDVDGDGMPDIVAVHTWSDGTLHYQVYLNTSTRTVPSEPRILSATAGSGQVSVAFAPSVASGASPITGYTATCRSGKSSASATGTGSPLTVTGLVNDRPYLCSVVAFSAAGKSMPSAALPPAPPSTYSRDYVQKAYVAYYGRPADPAGLNYWAQRMDAEGRSLNAIIGAFGFSDEFNRRYGGLSYTDLVTRIYQQTLGRNPDPAGLSYYVGELQAGRRTLQSITLDVLNGATTAPDSTVVANKLDVAAYYTAKVAAGCPYGTEQDGVNIISGVTSNAATVTAVKAAIGSRCGT